MKPIFLIGLFLILVSSCLQEPNIDIPNRFQVSKGVYDNKIELRWDAPLNSNTFEIYKAETLYGEYTLQGKTENTFLIDSSEIKPAQTYYYKIRVYNSKDECSFFSSADSGYVSEKYQLVKTFGDFNSAYAIDFDSNNNIYVSDAEVGTVKKFDKDGKFISDLVHLPGIIIRGIKVLENDQIVISESNKGQIAFFDKAGTMFSERTVAQTTMLREITVDDRSVPYVVDMQNKYIVKLDTILSKWQPTHVSGIDYHPYGLEYCDTSLVVGGSDGDNYVEFFSRKGKFIRGFELNSPIMYIAKDKDLNLYFASFSKVIKTNQKGKVLATIGLGYLESAISVNVNSLGDVFIADEKKPKVISVFRKT